MKSSNRSSQIPISIFNFPSQNSFVQAPSPSSQYGLYHVSGKRICVQVYELFIHKSKLFGNLEIYQWRNQTQFPVVKTRYINIKQSHPNSPNQLQLEVYNQHCPLKMNIIYQMSLAQTLYILKESIIGFQRLLNRFGPFQIKENMIAVNQKGYCKVWINQNFSLNYPIKYELNQQIMVENILQIMQNHCVQTKKSQQLFYKLSKCRTFLELLKQTHSFIISSRVLVPNRFVLANSLRQIPILEQNTQISRKQLENVSLQNIRYSIVSNRINKNMETSKELNLTQQQQSKQKSIRNQIKRFKSLQRLKAANKMKISDGETAYTRNNRQTKFSHVGGVYNSPREANNHYQKSGPQNSRLKKTKYGDQSSFIMQIQGQRQGNVGGQKKQLSYSTAAIKSQKILKTNKNNRKLSAKIRSMNLQNYRQKFKTCYDQVRKSQHDYKQDGYNIVIKKTDSQDQGSSRRKKVEQQVEQDSKVRQSITDTIMRNNGWNCVAGFFQSSPKELNQSFHEGLEVYVNNKQLSLDKLNSIGKRDVSMSILPEQYQQLN